MKTMLWQEMAAHELVAAVRATGGVCLVPIGCLEKHAEHLPIGTDVLAAEAIAQGAARLEPAVVFPAQHLAVTNELKSFAGVIATPTHLLIQVWENLLDEIARNGFKKIVLVNFHGGNRFLLGQLIIDLMDRPRDYVVYWPRRLEDPELSKKLMESDYESHAGELETSLIMHLRPELVHRDAIGLLDGRPQRPAQPFGADVYTSADWFSLHPTHYGGDARAATAAKGKAVFEAAVKTLAGGVEKIKSDKKLPGMLAEYYRLSRNGQRSAAPAKKPSRRKTGGRPRAR